MIPTFPLTKFDSHIVASDNSSYVTVTSIATLVRKKHTDGRWYKTYFFRRAHGPATGAVNAFMHEIYLFLLVGHVLVGRENVTLDEDQRSEEARLTGIIK